MVTTPLGTDAASILYKMALGLGAVYLVTAAYLTVQQAVAVSGQRGSADGRDRFSVEVLSKLLPGEREEAAQEMRSVLAQSPLDASLLLDLSYLAQSEGNNDAAERLKLAAGQLRPRAISIQAEAMQILLKRRDFDSVMSRLDGLVRARPLRAKDFFAVAAGIASAEDGSRAVARMLGTDPPWRPQFFRYVVSNGPAGTTQRIFSDMRSMNIPVQSSELSTLIDNLLGKNDADAAYAVWLSSLNESELKEVRRVYDGNFTQPIRNLRFDWTVTPKGGLTYRHFPRSTASMDQTLQLVFHNFAGSFSNLSQILQLKPGRYQLSGETRFEDYESASSLTFRLYCVESGKLHLLDETPSLPQSSQWMSFEKPFQVPIDGCQYQLLRMESKIKLETDQTTLGLVAIDAINVDTMPELAP